jgi:hypothetical protein
MYFCLIHLDGKEIFFRYVFRAYLNLYRSEVFLVLPLKGLVTSCPGCELVGEVQWMCTSGASYFSRRYLRKQSRND